MQKRPYATISIIVHVVLILGLILFSRNSDKKEEVIEPLQMLEAGPAPTITIPPVKQVPKTQPKEPIIETKKTVKDKAILEPKKQSDYQEKKKPVKKKIIKRKIVPKPKVTKKVSTKPKSTIKSDLRKKMEELEKKFIEPSEALKSEKKSP